jgi:hypothetical protein
MLIINTPDSFERALNSCLAENIKRLLAARADLIDLATFVIPAPGDSMADIEAATGIPIATNFIDGARYGEPDFTPSFEWVMDHGALYEIPYVLSDDGSGVILIVPDSEGVDPDLLSLARDHTIPANQSDAVEGGSEQPIAN